MLSWRLLLSALFVPAVIAICWTDSLLRPRGLILTPLALLVAVLAVEELIGLFASIGMKASRAICHTGCWGILLSVSLAHWLPELGGPEVERWAFAPIALAAAVGMAFWDGLGHRDAAPGGLQRFGLETVTFVYIGWLLAFALQMVWIGPDGDWGLLALGSLLLIVKAGDTGAYVVGRLLGRTKLAPRNSPGKTVEGAFGGVLFSLLAVAALLEWIAPLMAGWTPLSQSTLERPWTFWTGWIAFGLLVNLAGLLGDLAESLLKRSVGRKESSHWMPGFGGVLDLSDSVLLAAPVAYVFWAWQLVGPA